MHKHNNPAETAVVVYGLDQQRGKGEGKEAEEQAGVGNRVPVAYDRDYGRGWCQERACSLRPGTVLSWKVVGKTAHSPFQSDSPVRQ